MSLKRRVSSESIIIEVRRAINWGGASTLALFEILGSAVKIGENRNPDEGSNRFISVVYCWLFIHHCVSSAIGYALVRRSALC